MLHMYYILLQYRSKSRLHVWCSFCFNLLLWITVIISCPDCLHSLISDGKNVFDYSLPLRPILPNNTVPTTSYNYTLSPPPIPSRTYRPYASFTSDTNFSGANTYHNNDIYNTRNNSRPLSWQQKPCTQYPPVFSSTSSYEHSDYPSLPSRKSSFKSRDDDDCSTTTSGSYSLYSAEDLLWPNIQCSKWLEMATYCNLCVCLWYYKLVHKGNGSQTYDDLHAVHQLLSDTI